jgi:hypothetical protein
METIFGEKISTNKVFRIIEEKKLAIRVSNIEDKP